MSWYAFFKSLLGAVCRIISPVRVEGLEHLPEEGAFLLVPNHQSILDPFYIQSSIRRNDVFTLTKSTQFAGILRWVLPRVNALPTRRFRVDPQVVRTVLRHLEAGHGICIYPEGERSWDGSVQPLRKGAVRLVLKSGVPVVPCGISGSFDVWPRWSRRVLRRPVTVRFGRPFRFGRVDDRRERNERLEETEARIRGALSKLSGAPLARTPTGGGERAVALRGGERAEKGLSGERNG